MRRLCAVVSAGTSVRARRQRVAVVGGKGSRYSMDARFRVRTREGKQIEPKTFEAFAEMVRSGVLRAEDKVFDALTGDWVPAGAHPMVQLLRDPLASDPDGMAPAGFDAGDDALNLDLVQTPSTSPEDAAREFIEKMEAERLSDPEVAPIAHEMPLDLKPTGASPAGTRSETTSSFAAEVEAPMTIRRSDASVQVGAPLAPRRERTPWRRTSRKSVLLGGFVVALVGISAGTARTWIRAGEATSAIAVQSGGAPPVSADRAPRPIPASEEDIRALASIRFLSAVDDLRQELDVGDIPQSWLEGRYLSAPADFPEVRAFWEHYLAYVEAARAGEARLYRSAYLEAATRSGISGPVRSLRLASALEDFEAHRKDRAQHYDQVRDLVLASLALDDRLRELNGRVSYEPARGNKLSADPVVEAAGKDVAAQEALEQSLDEVLQAVAAAGAIGVGDRNALALWLVKGLGRVLGSVDGDGDGDTQGDSSGGAAGDAQPTS